jgi:hypothetical protein
MGAQHAFRRTDGQPELDFAHVPSRLLLYRVLICDAEGNSRMRVLVETEGCNETAPDVGKAFPDVSPAVVKVRQSYPRNRRRRPIVVKELCYKPEGRGFDIR